MSALPPEVAKTGAFLTWEQPPKTEPNPARTDLSGLTFSVKDLIDVKGHVTGAIVLFGEEPTTKILFFRSRQSDLGIPTKPGCLQCRHVPILLLQFLI